MVDIWESFLNPRRDQTPKHPDALKDEPNLKPHSGGNVRIQDNDGEDSEFIGLICIRTYSMVNILSGLLLW